jgi:hypothetical protein
MSGAISQMQMRYSSEEDRILFRVNSTDKREYRLWITRRFSLMLMKLLRDYMDADPDVSMQASPDAKQAVKEFKQESAIQAANFKQEFAEDSTELPLGEETPLAFKLTHAIRGEKLNLSLDPRSGQGMNLVLDRKINASLIQLLTSAIEIANWKLEEDMSTPDPEKDERVIN